MDHFHAICNRVIAGLRVGSFVQHWRVLTEGSNEVRRSSRVGGVALGNDVNPVPASYVIELARRLSREQKSRLCNAALRAYELFRPPGFHVSNAGLPKNAS